MHIFWHDSPCSLCRTPKLCGNAQQRPKRPGGLLPEELNFIILASVVSKLSNTQCGNLRIFLVLRFLREINLRRFLGPSK